MITTQNKTSFNLSGNVFVISKGLVNATTNKRSSFRDRGQIQKFSESSGIRMRRYLRSCKADYSHMVTLTYPSEYDRDGRKSKQHLKRFVQELARNVVARNPKHTTDFSIFWFMEFQERGAIHYHLFVTCYFDYKYIARLWAKIVNSKDENHIFAGTRTEKLKQGRAGTVSYACKYAQKQAQKVVPDDILNCGRFWGISGLKATVSAHTDVRERELGLPTIKNAYNRISGLIKDGISTKKITYNRYFDTYVYILHCEDLKKELWACIEEMDDYLRLKFDKEWAEKAFFRESQEYYEEIEINKIIKCQSSVKTYQIAQKNAYLLKKMLLG